MGIRRQETKPKPKPKPNWRSAAGSGRRRDSVRGMDTPACGRDAEDAKSKTGEETIVDLAWETNHNTVSLA
eukprot:scaffold599_cov282-Pinguiococcus_pyrenoidosus.AAC.1